MEFEKLKEIISQQLNIDESLITADTVLRDDLGVDSLELYEVLTAIEDEFDIEIDEDDVENIITVGDAVDYIENNK